jgi:hypothetical protein
LVQKWVIGLPRLEHSGAICVVEQSFCDAQNLPIPSSLPVSPGLPHRLWNASIAASGFELPPPQAQTRTKEMMMARMLQLARKNIPQCNVKVNDSAQVF